MSSSRNLTPQSQYWQYMDEAIELYVGSNYKYSNSTITQMLVDKYKLKYPATKNAIGLILRDFRTKEREKKLGKIEPKKTTSSQVTTDLILRRNRAEKDEWKKKYQHLLEKYEESEKRYNEFVLIKNKVDIGAIEPKLSESKNEAIAIAQLSDGHVGEKVDPSTVNGWNEFTPEIADQRYYSFFQNLLKMVIYRRQYTHIDTLFLSLTGDNITGYIHEELRENNYLSPTEETRLAKRLILRGLEFLLNHGKFKKIIVQCNWGNHGRLSPIKTFATAYKNSYEYMMYQDLADYFKDESIIQFIISESNLVYSPPLFGRVIRTFHGDELRYNGGIGGLTVPLYKYILRLDAHGKADMNMIGHWHTKLHPIKNCVVNGSIIGYNAYAQKLGMAPEPPMQTFMLLDKKRGFVENATLFCE